MGTPEATATPVPAVVRDSLATRVCTALTKAGAPCKASPMRDRDVCSIHGNVLDPAELGRLGGLASGETRREQGKSVRDRLREKVEGQFERVWSAFDGALDSEDERVRVGAAQAVLAEAYGRPPQAIVGDIEKPLSFTVVSAFAQPEEKA